ncbi:hypothetical protein M011DRAFT_417432 [Sporormia fimetaria CBS 119925]|uniref:Large ribosomal subunit protein bL21m n=1 Tax=Sporormia fimetaria CBS 119925 TaxID=1340428 RepID=A0A6A6VK25_9PLEO|nr:hypothetical protein M011DRAFT_417432 [Sporormia fimetaria CBS 119925]
MALFAPTLRRSLIQATPRTSSAPSALPPTFLLPFRAHLTTATVSHTLDPGTTPEPLIQSGQRVSSALTQKLSSGVAQSQAAAKAPAPASAIRELPYARKSVTTSGLTPSIRQLLPLLQTQPAHYITIHIHGRPYLVTRGDEVRLPFLMQGVGPGDVLRLNRATHIGSRDYTLKAPEAVKGTRDEPKKVFYLDEKLFVCRATVIGTEMEPMRVMEKTKRRQRHVRHVFSQHKYTVLKISQLEIKSLEQYERLLKVE